MATRDRPAPVSRRAGTRVVVGSGHAVALLVAVGAFLLAFGNGTYAADRRFGLGVAVWWAVFVVVLVGVRGARVSLAAVAVGGALTVFAAWTLASVAWSSNAEAAYTEFARVALYLGLLVLVVALARREVAGFWADGLALGILAVAATGLASRLYPDAVGSSAGLSTLPVLGSRLSYPIGYWNGLGVLAAMGMPLVLSSALRARLRPARALFLAALPLLAATIYLTSSRGAVATAAVGVLMFLVLVDRRWSALGALVFAAAGSALGVTVLADRSALANGVRSATATSEGRAASAWLAVVVAATAVAYGLALSVPRPRRQPSPAVGWIAAAAAAAAILAVVVAAHPMSRFDHFREPPASSGVAPTDPIRAHLLSASGSGRWQFWQASVDEYRTRPLTGRGAGSYAEWWSQHGSLANTIHDAHSLYVETLGELGVIGLVLLLALVLSALAVVFRAARGASVRERAVAAGVGGSFCGFLVAAGIDWMWELTAVAAVAFVCLGLAVVLAGGQTLSAPGSRGLRIGAWSAAAVAALLLVLAEAVPLLAQVEIGRSQSAARGGHTAAALDHARSAARIQPWAASPFVQLALAEEQAGALSSARGAVERAIQHDPAGWQPRLIAARLEAESGDVAAAARSLAKARSLNPRSPLFRNR